MKSNRRQFLTYSAVIASSAALSNSLLADAANPAKVSARGKVVSEKSSWKDVREQFVLDPKKIHLAGLFLASHPKSVRDAIENYRKQLDENPVDAHNSLGNDKEVLKRAALYLGTKPELIAQTNSTTMGLGLMYGGFRLNAGDQSSRRYTSITRPKSRCG